MTEQWPLGDSREQDASDGLLFYLQTLCRVAHAAGESHWCTPGHNRGRALERPATVVALSDRRVAASRAAGTPRGTALHGVSLSWWDGLAPSFDRAEA
jgi:hypothetical protein